MYILGVSGGPDSMAMLDMYKKKAKAVCVVNYQKRSDSNIDVECVKSYCELHNIKYYVLNVTKKMYNDYSSDSNFQTVARKIRYDFFKKTCELENVHKIMIAHNLNDHMETAYMQLNRNSKSLFYGIQPKSMYEGIKIYRPLIKLQKSTLERYCVQNEVKYAIDSSNTEDVYERNKVRKIILGWDQNKVISFLSEIRKYNKQHQKMLKLKNKYFKQWNDKEFNVNFLLSKEEKFHYYMIYDFLKANGEKNNSKNKIEAIIDFIKSKNWSNAYRLEANKNLKIINQCLKIQYK
ncbi:MAG: tRNA lysidine(34) synthetase TilS [Mycoplasma sp.]